MNFIKVFIYYLKKKYGYLAQRFTKEEVSKVSKGVQDKQSNEDMSVVLNFEGHTYWFPNKEILKKNVPTGDTSLERCIRAYIEEEKERERHTVKR